ncbi:MAG: hypothetical protein K5978_08410 [Campylobacter sp.]|nr:hypothetical protein [Campylobacter sp.]
MTRRIFTNAVVAGVLEAKFAVIFGLFANQSKAEADLLFDDFKTKLNTHVCRRDARQYFANDFLNFRCIKTKF